jgi:hypothetical protein
VKLIGFLVKLVGFVLLLVVLAVAWLRFSEARTAAVAEGGAAPTPEESAELASEAGARFERAVESRAESVELSEAELASLLQQGLESELPGGMSTTGVLLTEGEARVRGRVELALLPPMTWLDPVRRVLPQEVPVELRCAVLAVEDGEAVLLIRGLSIAGIPVPRSAYSRLLPELGEGASDGLPPEAIRVRVPSSIGSIEIGEDRVVVGVTQ